MSANDTTSSRSKSSAERVSRDSTATLANGVWINAKIIHFVDRVLITPRQNTGQTKTHIHSTFFMSRLLEGAGRRIYNFEAARNNNSRIEGGLRSLDKLYIPINRNNVHRIFIRVEIVNNTIHLFDLQGMNNKNMKYLQATEHYIYEALTKGQGIRRQNFC